MGTNHTVLNKRVFTSAAFAAVILSALLMKFFSDLALASAPLPLSATPEAIENLGVYRVADINRDNRKNLCLDMAGQPLDPAGRDASCFKTLRVMRTPTRVAVFEETNRGTFKAFLFNGKTAGKRCRTEVRRARDPFHSGLCHGAPMPKLDTADAESFVGGRDLSSIDPLGVTAVLMLAGSYTQVAMPKGVTVPDKINVDRTVEGAFLLFLPAGFTDHHLLVRIGD